MKCWPTLRWVREVGKRGLGWSYPEVTERWVREGGKETMEREKYENERWVREGGREMMGRG